MVTVESHAADGALTGSTTVTLPSGGRLTREVSELLGSVLPTGSYLRVVSAQPVQALGLLGNDKTGAVMPVAMVVLNAPAAAGGAGGRYLATAAVEVKENKPADQNRGGGDPRPGDDARYGDAAIAVEHEGRPVLGLRELVAGAQEARAWRHGAPRLWFRPAPGGGRRAA